MFEEEESEETLLHNNTSRAFTSKYLRRYSGGHTCRICKKSSKSKNNVITKLFSVKTCEKGSLRKQFFCEQHKPETPFSIEDAIMKEHNYAYIPGKYDAERFKLNQEYIWKLENQVSSLEKQSSLQSQANQILEDTCFMNFYTTFDDKQWFLQCMDVILEFSKNAPKNLKMQDIPKGPWTKDFRSFPKTFSEQKLLSYKEVKKEGSVKHHLLGYRMFKASKVSDIYLHYSINSVLVKANVEATMKRQRYLCHIHIDNFGIVGREKCGCMGGISGRCKHIFAVLYQLLDHLREERTNVLDEPVPPTSQPRTWSTGSDRQVVKQQFHDLKFNKPDPNKPNKRAAAIQECRTTFNRHHLENNLSPIIIKEFAESLEKNNLTMFSEVLASHNYEPISIKLPNNPTNKNECDSLKRPKELPLPLKINWIWCQEYLKVVFCESLPNIDFINNVSLSLDDCRFLEVETRNQSSSSRWHLERKKRISASKFGAIIKRTIPVTIQLISRIWPSTGFKSAMMQQGLINETAAVSKYKDLYPNVDVFTCGLCVNPGIPFLAASPDRLVYDPEENTVNLLEIKTLVKSGLLENQQVLEAFSKGSVSYLELYNGNLQLRRNQDFFFQVQGQMAITGIGICDFLIDSGSDFFVERIDFDERFWIQQCLPKLTRFFFQYFQ
ncbi:unnamed protein product [Ceutorhynchus assimilis]|uniref:SWIM-type domain-containing protein n=1 Tax=Ceutorhynchus assimilis TaxID=467358 RepID=A0A9N9MVL6_9CUCU|nr:unnamed protein product [Ceutorhynchus assimilis]